jgi:hypothetical protein
MPSLGEIVDTALVRSFVADVSPLPTGYASIKMQLDSTGAIEGARIEQSNLPEASQRRLVALVASNVKPQSSAAPRVLRIRLETSLAGLRYQMLPAVDCAQ